MDNHDPITQKALFRYQVISAYLAADPPRGKRRQYPRTPGLQNLDAPIRRRS